MTPATTLVMIEERRRHDVEQAWRTAAFYRAKELPRSPDDLFRKSGAAAEQSAEQSDTIMIAMAKVREAAKAAEAKPKPKQKT